jgi:hypothetical protein
MIRYLFWAIAFYLMIRFIFNFVIPVFRATKQMKSQMRDFQSRMQEQQEKPYQHTQQRSSSDDVKKGDYIDFEEVK